MSTAAPAAPVRQADEFEIEGWLIAVSRQIGRVHHWGAHASRDTAVSFQSTFPGRAVTEVTVAELVTFIENERLKEGETKLDAETLAEFIRKDAGK